MAVPPTMAEALSAIRRCLDEDRLLQTNELRERLWQRGYTIHDVHRIIRIGRVEQAIRWREDHSNFEVRIKARTLDGRLTRVVLGLSESTLYGLLVTVIDLDSQV
ncbi:MAG: hypothetical protein KDC10_16335 [Calditrichaeota bacterium]|nr:hypothetical protein [Calditrichota bacterium]